MDITPKQLTVFVNGLKWKLGRIASHLQNLDRDISTIRGDGESAYKDWKANPPTLTAVLHEPQPIKSEREAQNTRREQREIAAAGRDRTRLFIEAAGIVIAGVLAALTLQSVKIAKIAAIAAERSASASAAQANAANTQAEAARASAENTLLTFRQDQRAWIGISGFDIRVKVGEPMFSQAFLTNSGKTIARNV
jgi:hypothetical protein